MKKMLTVALALIMMLSLMSISAFAMEADTASTIAQVVFDTSCKSKEFNVSADFMVISLTNSKNVREIFGEDLGYVVWSADQLTADQQTALFDYMQENGHGQFKHMNAGNTEFLFADNNPYTAGVTFELVDGQINALSAEIKNSNVWNMVAYGTLAAETEETTEETTEVAVINEIVESIVVNTIIEETVPMAGTVIIDEEPIPLADVPATGDPLTLMAAVSLLSGAGVYFTRKKRDEE